MKNLNIWLDDIRDPKKLLIQKKFGAKGNELWIKTGEKLLRILKNPKYKIFSISFDHDLGDNAQMTGYDIANEIERLCYLKKMKCPEYTIHSANPIGAKRISLAMKNAKKYSSTT